MGTYLTFLQYTRFQEATKKGIIMNILPFIIIFIIVCIMFILPAVCFVKCPYDTILVVFKKNDRNRIIKYITGGGTFVVPFIQDYSYIPYPILCFPIPLKDAPARNNVRITMPIAFSVVLCNDDDYLEKAVSFLIDKKTNEIEEHVKKIIIEQLRLTIASFSVEEIFSDKEKFLTQIRNDVDRRLKKIGLTTTNMYCTDLTDDAGYFIEVGRKMSEEALERAKADIARAKEAEAKSESDAAG